ncbi:GroES-like protein [Ditylenchus destructor]|uniref:GroES-like protein n=1 Tax=Ditylenchus destructor TaxID=166010 RepID=A0AAD4MZQ6_9BILA|nr:GroES-like protein [Ditylenchus destructor]
MIDIIRMEYDAGQVYLDYIVTKQAQTQQYCIMAMGCDCVHVGVECCVHLEWYLNVTKFAIEVRCFRALSHWSDEIMGIWRNCVHVSVISPLLGDMDRYGVAMGVASTAAKLFCRSYKSTLYGRWQSYAFFMPSAECLEELSLLIDQKKVFDPADSEFEVNFSIGNMAIPVLDSPPVLTILALRQNSSK